MESKDDVYVSFSLPDGGTGGSVCRLRLHVVLILELGHCLLSCMSVCVQGWVDNLNGCSGVLAGVCCYVVFMELII